MGFLTKITTRLNRNISTISKEIKSIDFQGVLELQEQLEFTLDAFCHICLTILEFTLLIIIIEISKLFSRLCLTF